MVLAILFSLGFFEELPQSKAVLGGKPALTDNAQVLIYENGESQGGGTVVAPNWVLTAAHLFRRADSSAYSLTFGAVDDGQGTSSQSNLRSIDRIVLHPTQADVALVHFAEPVPSTVLIPNLAQSAPNRFSPARVYGWGPDGHVLNSVITVVIDPVASTNAARWREMSEVFALDFPNGVDPMVSAVTTQPGDSGSGVFGADNSLIGVGSIVAPYRFSNGSGTLVGTTWKAAYEEPVWYFYDWINKIISGEGTSKTDPRQAPEGRRLEDLPSDGRLPMTLPPQSDSVAPGWPVGTLTAEADTEGLITLVCPTVAGQDNTCTMEGEGQTAEAIRPDDPVKIRVDSGRQVVAWCQATGSLAKGSEPVHVIRVSFTNAETAESSGSPTGFGWFDVDPAQVLVDETTIDAAGLATC